MRLIGSLLFGSLLSFTASAQSQSRLADNIDISRTIIAKLDRAVQNDPPSNFASSILVRVHQEASTFIETADSTSQLLRKGGSTDGTTMFALYSEFTDLYGQYDLFVSATATISPVKKLELASVMSQSMGKEFFEAKTFLEVATTAVLAEADDRLKQCLSTHTK